MKMLRKNNKLIWLLFIFLILPLKTFSFLKIDVEPRYVEMDVRKPLTKEITVMNKTTEFVRYKVSLEKPENLKEEYYMGNDIIIFPRVISLKPKGSQIIRLRLNKPIDTEGIDYATKICFDELVPDKSRSSKIPVPEGKVSIQTNYIVRLEMYALGSSGMVSPTVSLENAVIEEVTSDGKNFRFLVFKTINQGKNFFKPTARVELLEGKKEESAVREKFFSMIVQEEKRNLKIDITRFSVGDQLKIEIFDGREPKNVLFKNDIKI
jgi:hypothetical protein